MARRLRSVEVSSDEEGEAWQVKAVSVWSGLVGLGVSGLGGSGMLRFGWVS